jgi:glycosyltransferase involved in cell wall biosynthesis
MINKKHIAFLLPNVGGAGAERMMLNLAIGFSEEKFKVDLVLFKAEGAYLRNVPSNINIIELKVSRALSSIFRITNYLRDHKPTVLISTLNRVNIAAVISKKISGVNTQIILREANTFSVYTKMQNSFWDKVIYHAARFLYPYADNIVGVSRGVTDDIEKHFKRLSKNKLSVIYNPVVNKEVFELSIQKIDHPWYREGTPVILGVGRITPQKDFCTLIRAFEIVKKQIDVRLIILGSGKKEEGGTPVEYEKVTSLIHELNLEDIVDLPGFTKNPFAYMNKSTLFVLSSKWEGLPGVLIQALACGCPVVSTDCPSGPREVLNSGEFGKLVPIEDYEKMAEAIIVSIENPINKNIIIERAKEFSISKAVKNYSNLIK